MDSAGEHTGEIGGILVWANKFEGDKIPGSTRVPVSEIAEHFNGDTKKLVGLDLGSGSGRGTQILKDNLGCRVDAMDLSFSGLRGTDADLKIQANAEAVPVTENSYDFVVLCGVMTNLVDKDPNEAIKMRDSAVKEAFRILKPGGIVVVSDFSSDHELTDYGVNYERHSLITNEPGTIAVFKPESNISFRDLTDQQVRELGQSPDLVRFAHHYSPKELSSLFKNEKFNVRKISMEIGSTPSGRPIENLVLVAKKPKEVL